MGEMCPDGMTSDEFSAATNGSYTALYYVSWLQCAVVIVCAIILFGYYRRLGKPTFVWVMWGLFIVAEFAYLPVTKLYKATIDEAEAGGVGTDKYHRLLTYYNETVNIFLVTQMGGHWVFGIKYAEVVLKLPLLVFPETVGDIQARLKKISCAIWTLNGVFVALVLIYTLLVQLFVFGVWFGENEAKWGNRLAIVITLAPTVLLLIAVVKVRCMVSKLRNKAILQKENVILFHTVLFSVYFIILAVTALAINVAASAEVISKKCQATLVHIDADISLAIFNMFIIVLVTYMSVQFCKPLDGQWQQFLLGYREQSLEAYLREQHGASTDEEKARRFHEAAVQDANRQIMIISGLLNHTQSVIEQGGDSLDETSFNRLTSQERRILEDTTNTVEDSVLLHQIRVEVARSSFSYISPVQIKRSTINEADAAHTDDDY